MEKTPQQLYQERERRIMDAVALKKPDRVPVFGYSGLFGFERLGITRAEQIQDPEKSGEIAYKSALYFQPDLAMGGISLGPVLDALGFKQMKWAGHGLPENGFFQWAEAENMMPEEYDEFIFDPADFVVRKYWPRAAANLSAFQSLSPYRGFMAIFRWCRVSCLSAHRKDCGHWKRSGRPGKRRTGR